MNRSNEIIGSYTCSKCGCTVQSGHSCKYCNMEIKLSESILELQKTHHSEKHPGVGVGVLVLDSTGKKILLGQRKGSHGAGEYSFPGGWVEYGEPLIACAVREIKEETGLDVNPNDIYDLEWEESFEYMPKHIINFGFYTIYTGTDEPKVMEPDKCNGWAWYDLDDLPTPMGTLSQHLVEHYLDFIAYAD